MALKFETQTPNETIQTIDKFDYATERTELYYKTPCGKTFRQKYHDKYEVLRHIGKCRACAVVLGKSKRKKGFTQDEVAALFMHDYNCQSSSGNFKSENGILWHYQTVEAIKTLNGLIISNNECFSRGYAHCTKPPHIDYRLHLSLLQQAIGYDTIKAIHIVDYDKKSQNGSDATLIAYEQGNGTVRLFLQAYDDNGAFISELKTTATQPITTVKEAFASMKPRIVKMSEQLGVDVRRQGEFFFIPTEFKRATHIQKRESSECIHTWFECSKCGIKSERRRHPHFSWSAPPTLTPKQKVCCEKYHDENREMLEYKRLGVTFTPYPSITLKERIPRLDADKQKRVIDVVDIPTNHTATRIGLYTNTQQFSPSLTKTMTYTVVKGVVRHPQHRSLKLGQKLHIVVRNNTVQSWSNRGSGD